MPEPSKRFKEFAPSLDWGIGELLLLHGFTGWMSSMNIKLTAKSDTGAPRAVVLRDGPGEAVRRSESHADSRVE